MRQAFQDLEVGVTAVEDVPEPAVPPRHLIIRAGASLISAGTERLTSVGDGANGLAVGDHAASNGLHADRTRSVA